MANLDLELQSRRDWLGRLTASAGMASLGAGWLGGPRLLAAVAPPDPAAANDLGARVYNIRAYGAQGGGAVLDTAAVQAAIDACTRDGGGTVLVPAGDFLIGSVELKSHVTLCISAGGRLLGSANGKHYHAVDAIPLTGDSTLEDGNWALLFAVDAVNVTVEGPGSIDGQGIHFHAPTRGELAPSGLKGDQRPYTMLFYRCQNLSVRRIELVSSAYHCVRIIQSARVYLDGIYIHNRVNGNNDGFHFISCQHVTLSNCIVLSQDDACALFGSCQFVTITNCSFSTRWSVFRFGGGVAENIAVSNCLLHQVYGCPIKFHCPPGSRFENMSFSNLVLDDVTGPINIGVGGGENRRPGGESDAAAPHRPSDGGPGVVRNISFSNIHGTVTTNPASLPDYPFASGYRPGEGHSCITLNCVGAGVLEKISFDNIHLTFGGGGTPAEAAQRDLPNTVGEYFSLGPMPAFGFFARNTRALTLNNVRLEIASPEARPAMILDQVRDVVISGLGAQGDLGAESVLRLIDAKQVLLTAPRVLTPAAVFLRVEGSAADRIKIDGGDISLAARTLDFAKGAGEQAVSLRV